MEFNRNTRHALLSWLFVATVAGLAVVLAVLQYRWIGEVSAAERERLRAGLQTSLHRLSLDFNTELTSACMALLPSARPDEEEDPAPGYAERYAHWKETGHHTRLFHRLALLSVEEDSARLRILNPEKMTFEPAAWPAGWESVRDRVTGGFPGPRRFPGPLTAETAGLIELMRINMPGPERLERPPERFERQQPRRLEWLLVELDLDYVRGEILPELLQRHLAVNGKLDYDVDVVLRDNPAVSIFRSHPGSAPIGSHADASAAVMEVQFDQIFRRMAPGRPGMGMGMGRGLRRGAGRPPDSMQPDRGRWEVSVRHQAGSLETIVERNRRRNLTVISGLLLLMLAAVGALVRFTQRSQRLARLEMEFVAGVSHELRTPLSVIRTAAHNLSGGVVSNPKQVQRYGGLIADEAERLTTIVEQVLRFASTKAGRTIGAREPVPVASLIDGALAATARVLDESGCAIEKRVDENLPPVLADPVALTHALQNLLINAAKYGREGGWIGVSASMSPGGKVVEIRVADHGPGIPAEEVGQIFDPFYRGKRAIEDQIHGTGLGLNLVRRIVEAHEGTVSAQSTPGEVTEFLLRIPAASVEQPNEFANSTRRG